MFAKKLSRKFLYGIIFVLVGLVCPPAFAEGADNFGVHIFRGAELETACQMVQDADIGWHRGDVLWNGIVDNGGNFNWTNLDGQIESILGHKINIILTLRSIHELFAPGSGQIDVGYDTFWRSAPPAPEYLENYKDFIRQIVERYDGDGLSDVPFVNETRNIKHWQIENELANKPDGGSVLWKGTAADYADLFIVAYNVIKETDPEAKVALCGFTDNAIEYFMKYGNAFPLEVLKIINEKGSDFDIFDQHSYRDYRRLAKIITEVHKILGTYAKFTSKPIWVTETNVGIKQIDPSITPEEYNRFVAKDIVKRYSTLFSKAVKKVFWFKFSDNNDAMWKIPMAPKDFGKFRGLTESNLTPKPVYYTYKLLIGKIKYKEQVRKIPKGSYTWVYKFGQNDEAVYIMWYDSPLGESKEIKISLPWKSALITHVITELGVTEPVTEIKSTQDGFLQVTLDSNPIFVEKY